MLARLLDRPRGRLPQVIARLLPRRSFGLVMARQKGVGPYATLSFDCDFPRDIEVLPDLVKLLAAYGVRASFACIGRWIRAYPQEHRLLAAAGHEILNHTQTHPNLYHPGYDYARAEGLSRERFNEIGRQRRLDEIVACHQTCIEVLDYRPAGFRTPHFGNLHVDDVYGILAELGYGFSSSVLACQAPAGGPYLGPHGIWEFPLSPCPEHPLGVFDSWHGLGRKGGSHKGEGDLAGLYGRLLCHVASAGGHANVYFDPLDMMASGEMERVLRHMRDCQVEVLTYGELVLRLTRQPAPAPP